MPDTMMFRTLTHAHRQATGIPRGRWSLMLLGLLGLLVAPLACAEPAHVQVLLSERGGNYAELVTGIEQQLKASAPGRIRLQTQLVPDDTSQLTALLAEQPALVMPVGVRATTLMLRNAGSVPVLSLLISDASYKSLLNSHAAGITRNSTSHSAIYLDQPLQRQLDLLQLMLPNVRQVAALSGPTSQSQITELDRLCQRRGLELATRSVANGSNPIKPLAPLLDRAGVLLALPDPLVFNRTSLQAILLTTYHSGVPVLGFSQAYARAGALAAVYSTARQIGQQAGDWLAELAHTGQWHLGAPRHPAYYSIAVNHQVAQSLGIHVLDEKTLLAQLRQRDTVQP